MWISTGSRIESPDRVRMCVACRQAEAAPLLQNRHALSYTGITYIRRGAGNQTLNCVRIAAAKRAPKPATAEFGKVQDRPHQDFSVSGSSSLYNSSRETFFSATSASSTRKSTTFSSKI